jgi:hypothetical protein
MPGIAHAVVNNALTLGLNTLEWTKSKDGTYMKWAVEKVEGPAKCTLETRLCKTVLKVGDSCLTLADNTIESALNTSTFKTCEALVKTTYSNKLKPAVTNTAGVVVTTTNRVTTPVAKIYVGTLAIADRQVDYFLPGDRTETSITPTVVGLVRKVTRRTGRRIYVAKEWTVTKVGNVSNGVVFAVKQAHPVNVKKNVTALCWMALVRADQFVDCYLPDPSDTTPPPKGPISLGSKVVRRGAKRTAASARAAASAIRKSPTTFKAAARNAVTSARALHDSLHRRATASARAIVSYDYRAAASSRALSVVSAADRSLQRNRATAALRDFVVARLGGLVRRLLNMRTPVAAPVPAQLPPLPQPAAEKPVEVNPAEAVPAEASAPAETEPVSAPARSVSPASSQDEAAPVGASGPPALAPGSGIPRARRARAGEPHGARVPSE